MVIKTGTLHLRIDRGSDVRIEGIFIRASVACFIISIETFTAWPNAMTTKSRMTVNAVIMYAAMAQ